MPPLPSHLKQVDGLAVRDAPRDYGTPCSGSTWDCLNTPTQFGIIFSVVIIAVAIASAYWYAIVRPRQERTKESGEDTELGLGDGRTVVVSSGPRQRTVVFRDHRPPPAAYMPPTPCGCFSSTVESPQPSPRASTVQIWPLQRQVPPPQRPHTPQQTLQQLTTTPSVFQGDPLPGPYPRPMAIAMQPPQMVIPGPPPPPLAMMYPRSQPQTYFVIPPPPPPQPPPAQELMPPSPPLPPPPPPLSQPVSAGSHQQPPANLSQVRSRPPSPGHASTIEDSDSDRYGSLPPGSRQGRSPARGRSPPPGGSHFTRSRSLSPSERRRQHDQRHRRPNSSHSPRRGRQRERARHGTRDDGRVPQQDGPSSDSTKSNGTSYRSSTSLDSELRTDLASLLVEAGGHQRARETEHLQALVDRYDKEQEEKRAHHTESEAGHERDNLPRLLGQPLQPATHQAETGETMETKATHGGDGEYGTGNDEGGLKLLRRHVAFQEPSSPVVLESRVGRPSRRLQSPLRAPTREDLRHGESRVGQYRRARSLDKRTAQRRVVSSPSAVESRIGRLQHSSTPQKHGARRRHSHRFTDVGESRVAGGQQGRTRRRTHPSETFPLGRRPNYYNTHDEAHSGHTTTDNDHLINEATSEGSPSSAGATCATGSQASNDGNDQRRRLDLTPSRFSSDGNQHDNGKPRPYLRSPSAERSDGDRREKKNLKSSRGPKLASFFPAIARLATKIAVVREVADNIADEARTRDRRERVEDGGKLSVDHGSHEDQQAYLCPQPPQPFSDHQQRRGARRPHPQGRRQGAPWQQMPSNNRHRTHRRRPSTIHEEPRENLQAALEHAAERLAEEAVESALDRTHRGGGSHGGPADVMPGQDDQRRRRPRRSRDTQP